MPNVENMIRKASMLYQKTVPTTGEWDLVVAGGGPAGFAAAISAARLGARVLLLEASGALGGMATQGLVTSYDGMADGSQPLAGGIMKEILERLHATGLLPANVQPKAWRSGYLHPIKIRPEECKWFFDRMAKEAGLEVRYFTRAVDVVFGNDDRQVEGLILSDVGGLSHVRTKAVIDGTGDAAIAALAGAPFQQALHDTAHVMPSTLCFIMANIDESRKGNITAYAEQARADGHFRNAEVRFVPSKIGPGVYSFNAGHIFHFDACDPVQLSNAIMEGRDVVAEHVAYLRNYVPGYEGAVLAATAPLMGVRESRRIIGECVLTEEDYVSGRHFPDQIGIYNKEPDQHLYEPTEAAIAEHRRMREARIGWLPPGTSYGLPYGILVPQGGWKNLWVAGRSASTDVFVHSSSRVMPSCSMMGEAAGAAAVQSVRTGQPACELDTAMLVSQLRLQGAILPQTTLSSIMTRGSGKERGCTPIVRMSLDEPHVPAMQAALPKPKRQPVLRQPSRPEALRDCLRETATRLSASCCRSQFVNADAKIPAILREAGRCSDEQLLDLAETLQECMDHLCCQSSFDDDGKLSACLQEEKAGVGSLKSSGLTSGKRQ